MSLAICGGYQMHHKGMHMSCLIREANHPIILSCCAFVPPFASAYPQFLWTCKLNGEGSNWGFHSIMDIRVHNPVKYIVLQNTPLRKNAHMILITSIRRSTFEHIKVTTIVETLIQRPPNIKFKLMIAGCGPFVV